MMMLAETSRLRVNEFHARHGGECYLFDGCFWYADGAYRESDPLGALVDPPIARDDRSEYDLLNRKLTHFKAKLAVAKAEFDSLRETLTFSMPNDTEAALRQLEELRATVAARQEEFKLAQAAVDESAMGRRRVERRQHIQTEQAKVQNFREQVKAIRI